jgi:hypothetical protein
LKYKYKKVFRFYYFFYGTIHKVPELLQTEPLGKPALLVGMLTIDKLFTKVAQTLLAVIFEPTIIAQAQVFVSLLLPPNIEEYRPEAVLPRPPPINDKSQEAVLLLPPPTIV